ncbi:FtsH protease activity modulator HflK [Tahibacter amnicola]|uniref:Protein HflK n=1 Tax=Tahibacter amnicola TaxID=2976241 RepID=A0ABY6BIH0_9GAMM|nr:FtsH protease activity modulator HflK [Tahibacter amnicola]UXI69813.1 FtsH protease activity modulator HflK [Tahibacter amnicola]
MAWNEPGKRDPWRGNQKGPDVEETLRRLRERFGNLLGGSGGRSGGTGGILLVVLAIVLLWTVADTVTIINAQEVGVVQRFGKKNRVLGPGMSFKWPRPIETVTKVATTRVQSLDDEVVMLTMDENIVRIRFNVQYQISNAEDYLFKLRDAEGTVKEAAESAVRQVIGGSEMDHILSGEGAELVSETKKVLQQTLDSYESGLAVTEVNFQLVAPPDQVKEAFDDVTNARENKQQIENEARAYANTVVPEARGKAARIKAEAEGYSAERVALAKGDADRFELLMVQYKTAPEVTRQRLYLETMQEVLTESTKVIDTTGGRNLINLPVDRLGGALNSGGGVLLPSDEAVRAKREGSR